MALHVVDGNLVRDSLKAEIEDQPVEHRRGVVPFDCVTQNLVMKSCTKSNEPAKQQNW
jgi:hypothetical protein